jgi:hypothetical protein
LSFSFYQSHWDIVQHDVLQLVSSFYNHTLNLSKLNHATIILVPKGFDCTEIEQFRPISLINCSVKIIPKILANRISTLMNIFIDYTQTFLYKVEIFMTI